MSGWHRSLLVASIISAESIAAGGLKRKALRTVASQNRSWVVSDAELKFMHIPKTGGSSIDAANMDLPADDRAWDSVMLHTYECIAKKTEPAEPLSELYADSHNMPFVEYAGFMISHASCYHFLQQPDGSMCEAVHTTPLADKRIAEYFGASGSTTFCAIREPVSRFVSGMKMFLCPSGEKLDEAVTLLLGLLRLRPYTLGCLFVPQVEFVYGARSKEDATKQYCEAILHQENLTTEFDVFMQSRDLDVQLPKERYVDNWTDGCNISPADLSLEAKNLIYNFYKADYDAFGYGRPT